MDASRLTGLLSGSNHLSPAFYDLRLVGHCRRWHPEAPMTCMKSSPAIGAGFIPNVRFLATRLRAFDPFQPVVTWLSKVRWAAGSCHPVSKLLVYV